MSYLVIARKYRPETFSEVSGQIHVTRTLGNAISRNKVAHAYLFCGPRGVGKTSIARIFAKSLNCEQGPTSTPCLKCSNCLEIKAGKSLAVREIDGASHNSVDDVRDLIDNFRTLPPPNSKNKIYIIDEVHMLSTAAFNALLKSLEEPPPNTIFILATTEAHKILPTVLSRCQRFDLRALPIDEVQSCLQAICREEKVKISGESLRMIARLSDGSLRDAQSLLERVLAFSSEDVSLDDTALALGTVGKNQLLLLSQAIFNRDVEAALEKLSEVFATGLDSSLFLKEFVTHWHELLIAKFAGKKELMALGIEEDCQSELLRQVEPVAKSDLQDLVDLARRGADQALRSSYLKFSLESLIVRLATRIPVLDFAEVLNNLSGGEAQKKKPLVLAEVKTTPISKTPIRVATPIKPTAPITSAAVASKSGTEFVWRDFLDYVNKIAQPVMMESLKRISVDRFVYPQLQASANDLSLKYFNIPTNLARLKVILKDFTKLDEWQIKLSLAEQANYIPGSVHHQEAKSRFKDKQNRIAEILEDPNVKAMKELFPGSEIDR